MISPVLCKVVRYICCWQLFVNILNPRHFNCYIHLSFRVKRAKGVLSNILLIACYSKVLYDGSLCSVMATSQETLELHGQGKKHQSRAKAAAAQERSKTHGGDTGDLISGASKDDSKGADVKEVLATPSLDPTRSSVEKKRKQERIGEGGDLISTPSGNLEKKLKRGTYIEDKRLPEDGKDSQDKKRKLVEEHQETALEGNGHSLGKKSKKQGKLASGEVNGREEVEIGEPWVSESSGTFGKYKNGEQVNKEEKKGFHKDRIRSPLGNSSLIGNNEQTLGVEGTGESNLKSGDGKSNADKKTKKPKGLLDFEVSKRSDTSGKVQQKEEEGSKKAQNKEQKEAIVHEISFREWLGKDDGIHGGTPTHPPHDMYRARGNLDWPESVEKAKQFGNSRTNSTQEGIAKVGKWKKIIRDVLGKVNGFARILEAMYVPS